jgi:hypothetical protein
LDALYPWHRLLRTTVVAFALAIALVALPLAAIALGLVVFPIDFAATLVGVSAGGLTRGYLRIADAAFSPEGLPTWLPRLVVLVLGAAALLVAAEAWRGDRRSKRGPGWWRFVQAPLTTQSILDRSWMTLWDLLRGAAPLKQPAPLELARRYSEFLTDNLGQPGFRELVVTVHDLDARRDLVFAMIPEARRPGLVKRPTVVETDLRRGEVFDLAGVARDHLPDVLGASLVVPLATDTRATTFAVDGYWRGETHRLCDRPSSLVRLIRELGFLGVEQIVLVSDAPEPSRPHSLPPERLEGRARIGEYLRSFEAAVVDDVIRQSGRSTPRLFVIRPSHNPIGPFDFAGVFDVVSDRWATLHELMGRGYEDAYRLFIEPMVGGSGERVGQEAV